MLLSFKHINKPFLDYSIIKDFGTLQTLFFEVLAKKIESRSHSLIPEFASIPYLNSSLFDRIALEKEGKSIGGLYPNSLTLFSRSILRKDPRFKDKEALPLLEYLFEFLHAYDFTTTPKDISNGVKQNHDKLINSAVLGLVFEKLNGYKEGSFYTPSFITSYMCKESITEATLEKFNSIYSWKCQSLEELREEMGIKGFREHKEEYFQTLLSLKICDPSVGSGHFLVSALNEMIYIAYALKLIPALYESTLELENDEILIKTHDKLHQYTKPSSPAQISHQIQEELFNLKKAIIENCLFGVDINPNSCEITKLRLWIELLKYSYYLFDEKGKNTNALETLPNIDINIKCGNSLISNFPLDSNLVVGQTKSFSKNLKTQIQSYKDSVMLYKEGLGEKAKILQDIKNIKSLIISYLVEKNPTTLELKNFLQDFVRTYGDQVFDINTNFGFEMIKIVREKGYKFSPTLIDPDPKPLDKNAYKLLEKIQKSYETLENLKSSNAFEWRFEFPEVLDEEGNFLGFDCIIGNPPYGALLTDFEKKKYKEIYKSSSSDTAQLFIFLADKLLGKNGINTFIVPKALTFATNWGQIREFLKSNVSHIIDCGKAWSYVLLEMIIYSKKKDTPTRSYITGFLNEEQGISQILEVSKEYVELFSFYPNDLSKEELQIGVHIRENFSHNLGDYGKNFRGDNFQNAVLKQGDISVLGGREIQQYHIEGIKGYIEKDLKLTEKSTIQKNSILMQRLIAHIQNPIPHIKMTGTIIESEKAKKFRIVDTIYQIVCNSNISNFYVLGCLHSNFLNWYCYRFTFAKAIRTFQFSAETAMRIPIPKITESNQSIADKIIILVKEILKIKEQDSKANTQELESQIDSLVYALYNLTDEEIKIIEGEK